MREKLVRENHEGFFVIQEDGESGAGLLGAHYLGEIDAKPVAPTLILAGHSGGGRTEMLLNKTLVDFCGRGQADAQRMPGK